MHSYSSTMARSAQRNEIATTQRIGLILLCYANFAVLRLDSVVL